jgi:hypothetical protein
VSGQKIEVTSKQRFAIRIIENITGDKFTDNDCKSASYFINKHREVYNNYIQDQFKSEMKYKRGFKVGGNLK